MDFGDEILFVQINDPLEILAIVICQNENILEFCRITFKSIHTNLCIRSENQGPLSMDHLPLQMFSKRHSDSDIYHCKIPIAVIPDLCPYYSHLIPASKTNI